MTMRTDDKQGAAPHVGADRTGPTPFVWASIAFVAAFFALVGGWLLWDAATIGTVSTTTVAATTAAGPAVDAATPEPDLDIDVTYTPQQGPLTVGHVIVRNVSEEPIDVSGWTLATVGYGTRALELPAGSVIEAGASLGVHQIQTADCPTWTETAIWLCYDVFGPIDPPTFPGPSIDLVDDEGTVAAGFRP